MPPRSSRPDAGGRGDRRQIVHRPPEHTDHSTGGVGAALDHPIAQLEEPHQQGQGLSRIGRGDRPGDRPVLGLQIGQQRLASGGIDERGGAGDRRQALAHLPGGAVGPSGGGQGQPQPPLDHRIAAAHLDQQLGQGRGTEGFQVSGVEGALAGHGFTVDHGLTGACRRGRSGSD
jgi:hypothetical protein